MRKLVKKLGGFLFQQIQERKWELGLILLFALVFGWLVGFEYLFVLLFIGVFFYLAFQSDQEKEPKSPADPGTGED